MCNCNTHVQHAFFPSIACKPERNVSLAPLYCTLYSFIPVELKGSYGVNGNAARNWITKFTYVTMLSISHKYKQTCRVLLILHNSSAAPRLSGSASSVVEVLYLLSRFKISSHELRQLLLTSPVQIVYVHLNQRYLSLNFYYQLPICQPSNPCHSDSVVLCI